MFPKVERVRSWRLIVQQTRQGRVSVMLIYILSIEHQILLSHRGNVYNMIEIPDRQMG